MLRVAVSGGSNQGGQNMCFSKKTFCPNWQMHIISFPCLNISSPLNPPMFIFRYHHNSTVFLPEQYQFYHTLPYLTDIKEPINTTSDGTFLSVVCEPPPPPPPKVLLAKVGGLWPPPPAPPGITPLYYQAFTAPKYLLFWRTFTGGPQKLSWIILYTRKSLQRNHIATKC